MRIRFLQAFYGDAIFITIPCADGGSVNILIDGGPGPTYSAKSRKGKRVDGDLKLLIDELRDEGQVINLLILTHVDHDHIGGILSWFGEDVDAADIIKSVWFNSGKLISEYLNQPSDPARLLRFLRRTSNDTSISEGVIFEELILEKRIWHRELVKAPTEIDLSSNSKLTILSPDDRGLRALHKKWEEEEPAKDTARDYNDYEMSIAEHLEGDKFRSDQSIPNLSSIAFILSYSGRAFLFLADAHPRTVIDSLKRLGYSSDNKLEAEFVKLSHHGSKGNTNTDLLDLIQTKKFVISSNGDVHSLPDKRCLSRIINQVPESEFYFNYPEKADEIFSGEDRAAFPRFSTHGTDDLRF